MEQLARDTGKYCIGVKETLHALELGSVETLIVYESLDYVRYKLKNPRDDTEKTVYLSKEQAANAANFKDADEVDMNIISQEPLIEWFADNYKEFGCTLEFVTNKSQEGSQFVKGFGGVGGILRYKVDFESIDVAEETNDGDDDDFYL